MVLSLFLAQRLRVFNDVLLATYSGDEVILVQPPLTQWITIIY